MNTHTINRQIFELKVRSQENAFGLQQQVRAAWDVDVMPLLEELLDEIAGPDEVLRIDKLELDLGKIRAEKIGTDMKEKLREVLRTQLLKHKNESAELSPESVLYEHPAISVYENQVSKRISRSNSRRELLEYFFTSGTLPWWAGDEFETPDIDLLVTESFAKEPVSTWKWMHQLAISSPAALRRMSLQISPAVQKQILKSAINPVPVYLEKYAGRMTQLLISSGWTAPAQEESVQTVFAVSLLMQTAETITGSAEAEAIRTYISQLSVKMQTPVALLERRLYEGILSYAAKAPAAELKKEKALITHFIEWEKSEPEAAAQISGDETLTLASITDGERLSISEEAERVEQILKQFFLKLEMRMELRKKMNPSKKSARQTRISSAQEESEFENEEQIDPEEEAESILTIPVSEISEEEINTVTIRKEAEEEIAESISATGEKQPSIEILPSEIKSAKAENDEKPAGKKKPASENPTVKKKNKKKQEEEIIIPAEQKKTKAESVSEIKTERKTISESETIVTDPLAGPEAPEEKLTPEESKQNEEEYLEENKKRPAGMTRYGGLALLGPFISGLFSVLKLVNEKEFVSDEARNKAVFLLHYLATGKTKAPEFELSLHKLICGMKITDTVPRKAVLTAEEKTEAGLFLDDIAEQWPTLQGSSGEAMRNTFMRRNGIIEKKENAWLLRVERSPMDIMLDTLPWSLSIIKMPWMQQALYVEW